jgi:hypothetical protein
MNANFAFVNDGQIVFIDRRNNKIIPRQSLEMLLANLQLPFNPVKIWIQHPKRRTYHGITFSSGSSGARYNMFRGWPVNPKPLPCDNFLNFIFDVICDGNAKTYEWILDWLAQMFQFPEGKNESTVAIAMRGQKGVGKNFFAEHILELTGYRTQDSKRYGILIDQEDLIFGRFREHLLGRVLCVLDEVVWGGSKKNESQLKSLITADSIMIEPKGKKPFVADNLFRFIFMGNESWMVPASLDERRFLVLDIPSVHRKDYKYFGELQKAWNNGEREGFLYFLLHRKISNNLREAPWTDALRDQILQTLDPHQEWIVDCLDDGRFVCKSKDRESVLIDHPWQGETKIPIGIFYECYLDYISVRQKQKYALSKRTLKREIERFLGIEIRTWTDGQTRHYILPDPISLKSMEHLARFFPEDQAPF